MRWPKRLAILLAVCTIAANACTVPNRGAGDAVVATARAPVAAGDPVQGMLAVLNEMRRNHRLRPLSHDPQLARAAHVHARDMADHDFFSHRGSDGSRFSGRIQRQDYDFMVAAENIAAGRPTARETVELWMTSKGHRANILNPDVVEAGVGYVFRPNDDGPIQYKHYWVVTFGRRAS